MVEVDCGLGVAVASSWGMDLRTGESVELLTGRPVEGA